jgi:deazaflavin-dependent oxidoreductase (nitroreductase family)
MKPYRQSVGRRALNAVVRPLARIGLAGPRTYVLTVPGRKSGRLWSTPVSIVRTGGERWLVAPYGDRNWVKNARAAGWVELRRGRTHERLAVRELTPEEAVPVLREYWRLSRVTRPFFEASLELPAEAWVEEAPRHPVFLLLPQGRAPTEP